MPGKRHELVTELVEHAHDMLTALIAEQTGTVIPTYDKVLPGKESVTLRNPSQFFADGTRVFLENSIPKLAVVIEMQHRPEKKKLIDWPLFLMATRACYEGCPTFVVVVTVSTKTAVWAREAIDCGGGSVQPLVICLEELDSDADLGSAMLCAFIDGDRTKELEDLAEALADISEDLAKRYAGILLDGLQGEAFKTWRRIMERSKIGYQNDYAKELLAEGKLEGEARSILRVLASRGIDVPDRLSRKILACQDPSLLEHWLDNVAVTDDIERLFSE